MADSRGVFELSGFTTYFRVLALAIGTVLAFFQGAGPGSALGATGGLQTGAVDGIRLVSQETEGKLAAACVFVRAGSSLESAGKNGVTSLLNNIILSPNPAVDSPAVLEIEDLGGSVELETAAEYSCFRLTVPLKNLVPALCALGGAITSPPLNESVMRSEKRLLAGRYNMRRDTPVELGYRLFLKKAYPGNPYGQLPEGDPEALKSLGLRDVSDWHADKYVRENILVSICADIDYAVAEGMVRTAFGGMKAGSLSGADAPVKAQAARLSADGGDYGMRSAGTVALVGYNAPPADSPDYAAVKLAEALLADGMGSRLFRSLRVDGKLAYSFGSIMPPMSSDSRLAFYVSAKPGTIDEAARCITRSVDSLKEGQLTDTELARARGVAVGVLSLEGEGPVERARRAGLAGMLGVGQGYWEDLSARLRKTRAKDVVTAARKYMDGFTLVVLRPGAGGI